MARKVFYSYHHRPDGGRATQIRNMGVVDGNRPCPDDEWEAIARGGDERIRRWIEEQLAGTSCVLVLIGTETAGRKWIREEIETGWNQGKGVVGVCVHNLQDHDQGPSVKGANPFVGIRCGSSGEMLSSIVKVYDPPYSAGMFVYSFIKAHLANWVEEAIMIRKSSRRYRHMSDERIYG